MPFSNPIVAGSTLVRPAIQSPDYVAGVSGWAIKRDGTAEFNDVTVRGTIVSGNGLVTLNDGGVAVEDALAEYEINYSGGFLARRKPNDGSIYQHTIDGYYGRGQQPSPGNSLPSGFTAMGIAFLQQGGTEYVYTLIRGPAFTDVSRDDARIRLYGESSAGGPSFLDLDAGVVRVTRNILRDLQGFLYFRGQFDSAPVSNGAGSGSFNVAITFPTAFPAGTVPTVVQSFNCAAGAAVPYTSHLIGVPTNTGFSVRIHSSGAAAAWTTGFIDYAAFLT